ncbi:hypothetical protein KM043_008133 [Ampulex compressa]|nr:hypothetical protein KM043_008133 [Ampulex compressa]
MYETAEVPGCSRWNNAETEAVLPYLGALKKWVGLATPRASTLAPRVSESPVVLPVPFDPIFADQPAHPLPHAFRLECSSKVASLAAAICLLFQPSYPRNHRCPPDRRGESPGKGTRRKSGGSRRTRPVQDRGERPPGSCSARLDPSSWTIRPLATSASIDLSRCCSPECLVRVTRHLSPGRKHYLAV